VRPEQTAPRATKLRQRFGFRCRRTASVESDDTCPPALRSQESGFRIQESGWPGARRSRDSGARPERDCPGPVDDRVPPLDGFPPLGIPLALSLGVVSGRESRGKPVDGGGGDRAGFSRRCRLGRLPIWWVLPAEVEGVSNQVSGRPEAAARPARGRKTVSGRFLPGSVRTRQRVRASARPPRPPGRPGRRDTARPEAARGAALTGRGRDPPERDGGGTPPDRPGAARRRSAARRRRLAAARLSRARRPRAREEAPAEADERRASRARTRRL